MAMGHYGPLRMSVTCNTHVLQRDDDDDDDNRLLHEFDDDNIERRMTRKV